MIGAILLRPFGLGEWLWALGGAALLLAAGLIAPHQAWHAVEGGFDVYLFLAGMLTLAEIARAQGVFDWLASRMLKVAGGSQDLFLALVYGSGVLVTAMLSNDGTIVLLTPAVLAATRKTDVNPLPFLYACAFVANAASFLLPISNPANLVVFPVLPPLGQWLAAFGIAAAAAVVCTYGLLRLAVRTAMQRRYSVDGQDKALSTTGRIAFGAVAVSAMLLVAAAALGWRLGESAFILGMASVLLVACFDLPSARSVVRHGSWSVIPLVAALFVMVRALDQTGVLGLARRSLHGAGALAPALGNLATGGVVAVADNVLNNLPVGLIARYTTHADRVSPHIAHALLAGVDLGPNLSVTGSLATILWLMILRREGLEVTPWHFLRVGVVVLVPTLVLTMLLVR